MNTFKEILEIPKGKPRYLPKFTEIPSDIVEKFLKGVKREDENGLKPLWDFIDSYPFQQYICCECKKELTRDEVIHHVVGNFLHHITSYYDIDIELLHGYCKSCVHKEYEISDDMNCSLVDSWLDRGLFTPILDFPIPVV